jgi:hypothetical protein
LEKGNFKRKKIYKNNFHKIELIYKSKSDNDFLRDYVLLTLHKPTNELMKQLNQLFDHLCLFPILNKIELAWDFYSPYTFQLWDLLKRHLFLKFQRSPSNKYGNTYYTNNIRRSAKGIRLYLRPISSDRKKYVRLELEIHRSIIKKLDIDFPICRDSLDVKWNKYFDFRRIDWSKMYKYCIKQNREQIKKRNVEDPHSVPLYIDYIQSWVSRLVDIPLMEAVEKLKRRFTGIPNYSRFLVSEDRLNHLVENAAREQKFGVEKMEWYYCSNLK